MITRLKRWLLPGSIRYVLSLMYQGVIFAVVYFSLVSRCGTAIFSQTGFLLAAAFLALVALDQLERRRFGPQTALAPVLLLLLGRIVLITAVATLDDCSGFSAFLYPLIPFNVFFSLGPFWSSGLAFGYWLFYIWVYQPVTAAGEGSVFNFMIYTLLLVFMVTIASAIAGHERNQRRLEDLLAQFEAANIKLQRYAAQVAELAATEERNRLARDIHDSVGHRLTVVNIQLEKALAYKDRDPAEAEQAILDARHAAREALQDVRRSVGALRYPRERFSLADSLSEMVKGMENGRFTLEYQLTGSEEGYAYPVLISLYRAAQEGLTNAQKHAHASHVTMRVNLGEEAATLCLCDNGEGFDTAVLADLAAAKTHSFGLQGIQERLELVRGTLDISSHPGAGTDLRITIPKKVG